MLEQPRVGEFAHREVELHLVGGDVEPGPEGDHVLRYDRGLLPVEQRDADVAARDDLARELADHLPELHREERAADVAHHAGRALDHVVEFGVVWSVLAQHMGERVGDRAGDGFGELGPQGHGRGDPFMPAHELGFAREFGDRGDLVKPQGCHVQRLLEGGALGGQAHHGRAGRDALRLLEGEPPVDAVAAVLQGVLQLADELRDHLRVVRQPGGARESGRVDVRVARQEVAQHVTELVLGVLPGILSHVHYASRCPAAVAGN